MRANEIKSSKTDKINTTNIHEIKVHLLNTCHCFFFIFDYKNIFMYNIFITSNFFISTAKSNTCFVPVVLCLIASFRPASKRSDAAPLNTIDTSSIRIVLFSSLSPNPGRPRSPSIAFIFFNLSGNSARTRSKTLKRQIPPVTLVAFTFYQSIVGL